MNTAPISKEKESIVFLVLMLCIPILGIVFTFGERSFILLSVLVMSVIIIGSILFRAYLGILMLAFLIPLENFQVLPGAGITASKIIGMITLLSLFLKVATREIKGAYRTPIDAPLFCFLGFCILSLIPADNRISGLQKLLPVLSYTVFYYMVGALIFSKRRLFALIATLFFSISLASLTSLLQSKGITFGLSLEEHSQWIGGRFVTRTIGSFNDPNRFCTVLIIGLGIFFGLYRMSHIKLRLFLFMGFILIITSLYLSYSRSGYLALLVMVLVYLYLNARRRLFTSIVLFILLILLLYLFTPTDIKKHFAIAFSLEDESIMMRMKQYMASLSLLSKNWLFGVGIGNQHLKLIGAQVEFDLLETGLHCLPFAILLETGIFGFTSFCWLIVKGIMVLYRSFKQTNDPFLKGVFLSGILMISGYLTQNLFQNFWDLSILGLAPGILNAAWQIHRKEINEIQKSLV